MNDAAQIQEMVVSHTKKQLAEQVLYWREKNWRIPRDKWIASVLGAVALGMALGWSVGFFCGRFL